jgi:phage terminase large subunit GpA-like protein
MSLAEAEAWAPAERLTASEWAERYRKLPRRGRAEPGDFRLKRTPYMREVIDALGDSQHEEIVLMKPPQVAGSEGGRCAIAFWVDTRSDPILLVYPNEKAANEEITERIAPMFEESPQLRRHLTGRVYDANEEQIALLNCTIYVGWSGSAQALASRAIGCAVLEETDKYVRKPGEANPEDLARHRLKTFKGRRKLFALSSPTTKTGTIWRLFSKTRNKRRYYCPCVSCGELFLWSFDHVRWDGRERCDARDPEALLDVAERLSNGEARAWVACPACAAETHEQDRMRAVELGEWVSEGFAPGVRPKTKHVAYHLESLVSPWVSFADYVRAYLQGVLEGDLQDFLNGFRGLPAEEVAGKVSSSVFEERAKAHRAGLVPDWATLLTAGADTQAKDGLPYWEWVIRAWGPGLRSRLVARGRAESTQELVRATLNTAFPVDGAMRHPVRPSLLCVDSGGGVDTSDGSTTDIVYALAKSDPGRIVAVKGHGGSTRPDRLIRTANVDYQPRGRAPTSILLHTLDTEGLKDILARLIRSSELWEESSAADEDYVEQMTAEEKTLIRVGKRKRMAWINTTRRRNDIWDATVYCLAGAKILKAEERALGPPAARSSPAAPGTPRAPGARRAKDPAATRGDEDKPRRFGARRREGSWISRRNR